MLACGNYCGDSDVLLGMTLGIELDTLMVVASRGLVMVAMKRGRSGKAEEYEDGKGWTSWRVGWRAEKK